jgi:tellurite resistance protein
MTFDPATLLGDVGADKLEALVETMYLAADADGDFGEEERSELARSIAALVKGSPLAHDLATPKLGELLDRMRAALRAEGREARLRAVRDRLGDAASRRAAFGLSVRVAAADGIVRTSEREFILDLATALDVDSTEAADLVREITNA